MMDTNFQQLDGPTLVWTELVVHSVDWKQRCSPVSRYSSIDASPVSRIFRGIESAICEWVDERQTHRDLCHKYS